MKKKIDHGFIKKISRASFLKKTFLGISALLFPFACKRNHNLNPSPVPEDSAIKVYLVKNGTVQQNIAKLFELLGGISKYIQPTDIVVLKCNGQWPNQGYTNTECIKYVIESILSIPGYSGEILICDNVQNIPYDANCGFLASAENRSHNWPDHNWDTLAREYQSKGYPAAIKPWLNDPIDASISGPADGPGWIREFFTFHGNTTYLSYPVFESPLTPGRLIDMKNGVWENGKYTGRRVRAIFMPTLNNHGDGSEDYAGLTSALKSFFGATEIHVNEDATIYHDNKNCYHIHSATYSGHHAYYAGELAAHFIKNMYTPALYITCAIWTGYESRIGQAKETKTVLACENPATLDYVSSKYVIAPLAPWLNPDANNNTRNQILGCVNSGIGAIEIGKYQVIDYDFGS
jgi:hypothetical protein